VVAATMAATAAPAVPPKPISAAVDQATVVEIPHDDTPPPRVGSVGELARASSRARGGGPGGAGRRTRGATAADARR
jgi:hypothetical protein